MPAPWASPPAGPRPTTAITGGRCPRGWRTSTELSALLEPLRHRSRGVAASAARRGALQRRDVRAPTSYRAALHLDRAAHFAGSNYHEQVMAEHVAARAPGVEVWPQVSCRPLVFQMNLAEPFSLNTFPSFAALMDAPGRAAQSRPIGTAAWRSAAQAELTRVASASSMPHRCRSPSHHPARPGRPDGGRFGRAGAGDRLGRPLGCLAGRWPQSRFWSVLANNNEEGIAWLLPRDDVLLGLADSGAHVSQLCDACFATDLLGKWVRRP